jgi:hypothetical protein
MILYPIYRVLKTRIKKIIINSATKKCIAPVKPAIENKLIRIIKKAHF